MRTRSKYWLATEWGLWLSAVAHARVFAAQEHVTVDHAVVRKIDDIREELKAKYVGPVALTTAMKRALRLLRDVYYLGALKTHAFLSIDYRGNGMLCYGDGGLPYIVRKDAIAKLHSHRLIEADIPRGPNDERYKISEFGEIVSRFWDVHE